MSQSTESPTSSSQHVVVVGGGLAGLAATTALARSGLPVTLLESRQQLGGRATSFVDPQSGDVFDNCQHVSLGCCTNFRHFCRVIGMEHTLQRQRELYFIGPDGEVNQFSAARLPAPFHLLPAFRQLKYLTRDDLRAISRGLRKLCRWRADAPLPATSAHSAVSFAEWLAIQRQPPTAIERFWHVVIVSALSETLDRVDVAAAQKVFVTGFLANRDGWCVDIPSVPLSQFYGPVLADWLREHHVQVRAGTAVRKVCISQGTTTGVELANGEQLAATHVILAVPWHQIGRLLPDPVARQREFAQLAEIESAPISSMHFMFDRPITDLPHAVFVDRLSHWLFSRSLAATDRQSGHASDWLDTKSVSRPALVEHGHYYQVVISASGSLSGQSADDIETAILQDLKAVFPAAREARVLHSRLVTERRAVFSVQPGTARLRPGQRTPVLNLFLAGDWTTTGWPATMEGAVRSGYLAAEELSKSRNQRRRFLQPELPVAWLSRLLLGIQRDT